MNVSAEAHQSTSSSGDADGSTYVIVDDLVGKPALLFDEREEDYFELRHAFFNDLKPRGIFEVHLIEGAVNSTWDINRLRTWRVEVIRNATVQAGAELINRRCGELLHLSEGEQDVLLTQYKALLLKAIVGDEEARQALMECLREHGLTWQSIHAAALEYKLEKVRMIDSMLDQAERRRQSAIKDFQFIQTVKAAQLRKLSDAAIEDLPDDVVVPA